VHADGGLTQRTVLLLRQGNHDHDGPGRW
jgi:hypothetical protein